MQRLELSDHSLFRIPVGILCAVTGLSSLALLGVALLNQPTSWFLVGFEVVIAVAATMGVLAAMGRFREGPALTLLCIAGAVGVGSLLSYIGAGKFLAGQSLRPYLMIRLADAALFALAAGVIVLARSPREALPALVKGLLFGAVLCGIVAGAWVSRGWISSSAGPARAAIFIAMGIASISLIAASGHYLIRAFAVGADAHPVGSSAT